MLVSCVDIGDLGGFTVGVRHIVQVRHAVVESCNVGVVNSRRTPQLLDLIALRPSQVLMLLIVLLGSNQCAVLPGLVLVRWPVIKRRHALAIAIRACHSRLLVEDGLDAGNFCKFKVLLFFRHLEENLCLVKA